MEDIDAVNHAMLLSPKYTSIPGESPSTMQAPLIVPLLPLQEKAQICLASCEVVTLFFLIY